MNIMEFVYAQEGEVATDTFRIARHFGKRHSDVLRAFQRLECSAEFRQRNFALSMETMTYVDSSGQAAAAQTGRIASVNMTKDGFIFMVMGFTGKKAAAIKEAYIAAFNKMADELANVKLTYQRQMLALEARDAESLQWASWGSKKMLARKRDKNLIQREYARLMSEMQPSLFTH